MPGSVKPVKAGKRAEAAKGIIRAYSPADREAVRLICRTTAYRNRGSDSVFEDGELFADYWTRYYTDFEPESCLVVEEDGEVVGYLLGCRDTNEHIRVMSRRVVPAVLARAFWRLATFQYRKRSSRRMLYWLITRGWREVPEIPLERFPAHYHCNILRKGFGKSYYSRLALRFLDMLDREGVPGLHGQVEESAKGGPWRRMAEAFLRTTGQTAELELFAETQSTFQQYVLGVDKPMVNRAWGAKTDFYRHWMSWTGATYGL
jgi:hypothetical protein